MFSRGGGAAGGGMGVGYGGQPVQVSVEAVSSTLR
jgi:hypothetical protein